MMHHVRDASRIRSLFAAAGILAALPLIGCSGDALTAPTLDRPLLEPNSGAGAPTFNFSTIDVSGASTTSPQGINDSGHIVGSYRTPGAAAVVSFGFLRKKDGKFEPVLFPGYSHVTAQRILPNGTILG